MGFFSWDCKGCGHSIREGRGWMSKALVQGQDGDVATGSYDGYGRLDGSVGTTEVADMDGRFAMWHQTCFKLMDRPEFTSASRSASDQGMPPSDEFPEPRRADDLRALRELADERLRKERAQWKRHEDCRAAEKRVMGTTVCPHCRFDHFFVVERNGSLAIRCPNRDCKKLRAFPAELEQAWRALAVEFADQPVIWDDRKVGPHFTKVEYLREDLQRSDEELAEARKRGWPADVLREIELRIADTARALTDETERAEASERAEETL